MDSTTLVMSDRNGIEIDYCPQCRGVWLDRGELDKIIDRSVTAPPPAAYDPRQDRGYDDRARGGYGQQQPYRKKKESWLSELFD